MPELSRNKEKIRLSLHKQLRISKLKYITVKGVAELGETYKHNII